MSTPRHDTWMPLYVADYLKDTRHLSTTEHGAYLLLLMHAWTNGGNLPPEDSRLARIAGLSLREWRSVKRTVLPFFVPLSDSDEAVVAFIHKRIDAELARSQALTEKRSRAGARGAAGRWQSDAPANGKRMAKASPGQWQNDGPSQSHTLPSEESSARKPRLADEIVDRIWSEAPAKARERSSKADVRRTLAAALKRGGDFEEISGGLLAYWRSPDASKDGGAYAKGIHRMIEGDRWKDWAPGSTADTKPAGIDWAERVRIWRQTGQWLLQWGAPPGDPQCQCPRDLLEGL